MLPVVILLITTALVWTVILYSLRKVFSGRLRHPHRRARDLTPLIDVSIRLSPKIYYPLLPIATGFYVLALVPSVLSKSQPLLDSQQISSLSIFILSSVISYLYLVRNTTGINR